MKGKEDPMLKFGLKYFGFLGAMLFAFGNFIACGSQMYQVSVRDDFTPPPHASEEMNDPESTMYAIHSPGGWRDIPIPYKFGKGMTADQRAHMMKAMEIWETAVGKKLFEFAGDHNATGDSFNDLYSSLDDKVNGNYMDGNWAKTKKPNHVLATTIWDSEVDTGNIATADIRFNSEIYEIGDSLKLTATKDKEVVDMQSLALHELGHLLGLAHVDEAVDDHSIMNPSLYIGEGLTNRKISKGDILRIQTIYGCDGDACDADAILHSFEFAESASLNSN